jgi:L-ornithine N5-monooxygenase
MIDVYDVVGVGFGPANIALAIALEESVFEGRVLFLERQPSALWLPNMVLPGSDIQNHPCRDLVTPRNPRSRYTFLNFLHEHGLLFEHLNLGIEFPLRREYGQYILWASSFFSDRVRYNCNVSRLARCEMQGQQLFEVETSTGEYIFARSLVVAPGRTPHIPAICAPHLGPQVFHLTEYLSRLESLEKARSPKHVCVVGGSQSALEIMLHLSERDPQLRISNVMRGYGYRLKDTSQFSERAFFPEFVDYYYSCSREAKARLDKQLQTTNYSSADRDVINQLYLKLYEERLVGRQRLRLLANREVTSCARDKAHLSLQLHEVNTGEVTPLQEIDAIILATGFKNLGTEPHQERYPPILGDLVDSLEVDERGVLTIARDYRLPSRGGDPELAPIYLNGLCESSHGLGDAGSFSLLSLRASEISRSVTSTLHHRSGIRRRGTLARVTVSSV